MYVHSRAYHHSPRVSFGHEFGNYAALLPFRVHLGSVILPAGDDISMPSGPPLDSATLFDTHESERFDLHTRRLNEQMVRVLRTIGYDVGFCKGQGQYLYDRNGERYLDLLSGYGVFAIGRNHPAVRAALKSVLDADLPNLVQMDVSTLAGLLAQRLLTLVPHLEKGFFGNSRAGDGAD